MTEPDRQASTAELLRQREAIRRGLTLSNLGAVITVMLVILIALAAIRAAYKAERDSAAAMQSALQAREELGKSYLSQARALRLTGLSGQRVESLAAATAGARIHPSLELRNEAISSLALNDVSETAIFWPLPPESNGVDFDSDMQRYVSGDPTGALRVRRLSDNVELIRLPGTAIATIRRCFDPSGKFLAASLSDGSIRVWNLETKKIQFTSQLSTNETELYLRFNPNGRWLAVGDPRTGLVHLYDIETGGVRGQLQDQSPNLLSFHPIEDRLAVASAGGGEVRIWDLKSQRVVQKLSHTGALFALDWGEAGRLIAGGCREGEIVVWDLDRKTTKLLQGHSGMVPEIFFNPKWPLLCSRSWDGSSRLWDPYSGRPLVRIRKWSGRGFSRDGLRLGLEREGDGIGLAIVVPARVFRTIECDAGETKVVFCANFSPDGKYVAAAGRAGIRILEVAGGKEIAFLPIASANLWGNVARFGPDSEFLVASSPMGFHRWAIERSSEAASSALQFLQPQRWALPNGLQPGACWLSFDGRKLLTVAPMEKAFVMDIDQPTNRVEFEQAGVNYVSLSADQHWLATGTNHKKEKRLWNLATGKVERVLEAADGPVEFSPDGRWLLTGSARDFVLWDTTTWTPRHRIRREASNERSAHSAFSRDGKLLAIALTDDSVTLVEPESARVLARLQPPQAQTVNNMDLSPDGSHLSISTTPNEIGMWDITALRDEIQKLGLNWTAEPATLAATQSFSAQAGWFGLGSTGLQRVVWLSMTGIGLALVFAFLSLQRHRQLVRGYAAVERVAEQRHRDLEWAQTEMLHSEKMKALGTLAAGIAHDFNNLLSVIRMSKELVEEASSPQELRENTAEIEQAVQQGKNVVRSMLGYSRDGVAGETDYSAPDLVRELVGLLSREFLSGIELVFELDPLTPRIRGHRSHLEQLMLNLVVNAAEAMQNKGRLLIAVRPQTNNALQYVLLPAAADQYAEVVIQDSGPGIAPEILPRIFEPFFTTKKAGTQRGTGLGLSTVYQIAKSDGLGISVESTVGTGTLFRISLPIQPAEQCR